jgi:hypothetical protein
VAIPVRNKMMGKEEMESTLPVLFVRSDYRSLNE